MYLYNISVIIEESVHHEIVTWIRQHFIPSVDPSAQLLSMMDSPHDGVTYCIQLHIEHAADIAHFRETYLMELQRYLGESHTNKAFLFDSVMKYLETE